MNLDGISAQLLAELVNVPLTTAQRWKRAGRVPGRLQTIIALKLQADLGILDPAWQGYQLKQGLLWTPENDALTPAQIRAAPWWRGLANLL